MADASWTDYFGIVGMVTGVFGAIMGYVGYRRSNQIKALDMRVALRKDLAEAWGTIATLRKMMTDANASRQATLAARGLGHSGAWVAWEQNLETDRAELEEVVAATRGEDADFSALSERQLETELVTIHKVKATISTLLDKYRGEIAADDETRRQIAHQMAAITAARIGQNAQRND
ncbi:hypothetical protein [Burkholderia gladioli]|uniref:hypothetical protein n=1 Tax=Burkholderia gladioli TaxID=28095 RepID=UPI0016416B39|nr:hypothetical protein [Burkholderia gladioli]